MMHFKKRLLVGIFTGLLFGYIPNVTGQSAVQWKNLGPSGGFIRGLIADPKNPGTLLAGTPTGEIYKTTDEGQNWFYLNTTGKPIHKMIIDTSNGNYLYVFARHQGFDLSPQVFVSSNGGQSWSSTYTHDFGEVFDAYINPYNSTQLYALSREGLYKSINRGQSWSEVRLAGDSAEFTAFAVNPQNPWEHFYLAYNDIGGYGVIQTTMNGGYDCSTKLVLPPGYTIAKMFVANNSSSTVFAVISNNDSTKIIYSNTGGNNWNIALAAELPSTENLSALSWLTFPDPNTYVINLHSKFFKSNNGGLTWYEMPQSNPKNYPIEYFNRAPNDTVTFYANSEAVTRKYILGLSGYLSPVVIMNGLTAFPITKIHFADEENLIAQTDPDGLLFSMNLGLDFELIGCSRRPYGAFRSYASAKFIWIEDDGRYYSSSNGRTKTEEGLISFPAGTNHILDVFSMNYGDEYLDSSLMLVSTGHTGNPNAGGLLMTTNDGAGWININYGNVFTNQPVVSLSAYRTDFQGASRIRMLAATKNKIYARLKDGQPVWTAFDSIPLNYQIVKISSNFNTVLISARNESQMPRLYLSRFSPEKFQWKTEDITASLQPLFALYGEGNIVDIASADDGNYLILEHHPYEEPTKRKLYKIGYNPQSVRWVEISESPVDLFLFSSVGTNYTFQDNSFNLYASANNGIWMLKQTSLVTQDTVSTAPVTEVMIGESGFSVNYKNAGSAFANIDTFIIQNDPEGNFDFVDPGVLEEGLFLDIKTSTPLEMVFHPRSAGTKQATLEAHLVTRKSNGIQDSIVVMTTRLTGGTKYAQIGTGLKGDTLDFGGNLLGSSKIKTITLRNIGNAVLSVDTIFFTNPANNPFSLMNDTTSFELVPGQSLNLQVRYEAGFIDNTLTAPLILISNAYDPNLNQPDTLHRVYCTATASGIEVNLANNYPILNQNFTFDVTLSKLRNASVTGFVKYKNLGSPNSSMKQRNLELNNTGGNDLKFTATIPSEDISEKGLVLYVEVTDGSTTLKYPTGGDKEPTFIPVRIPSPGLNSSSYVNLPGGTGAKAYRMVSFPIQLSDHSPQGAFQASNLGEAGLKGDWQLYRYDHNAERFISLTEQSFGNVESGKSYLLITRKPKVLNSGPGQSLHPNDAFITIHPGWNMIASPYPFSIYWRTVVYKDSNLNLFNIVHLDNGRFRYVEDPFNLQLEPWKGYMYYSDMDSSFRINYPPLDANLFPGKMSEIDQPALTSSEYELQLTLQTKENEPLAVCRLGERSGARDGSDRFDRPALPLWEVQDAEFYIESKSFRRQTDIRALSGRGSYWELTLRNNGETNEWKLAVDGLQNLPNGYEVVVMDLKDGRLLSLQSLQNIKIKSHQTAQYRIAVGTMEYLAELKSGFIPSRYYLSANYPNPFNPATTIQYGVPVRSEAELAVYNMLGQKVKTLFKGNQEAGIHRLTWDGRNDAGATVASGVYIYRIRTRSLQDGRTFEQSRKMIFIK